MAKDRKHGERPLAEAERVGYGRPPKEHRFRPKHVGNPWGRKGKPKPEVDFLDELVSVQIGGKPQRVTRDQTIDLALYKTALAGKVSAAQELEKRRRERQANRRDDLIADVLSLEEQSAFDRLIERRARSLRSTDETEGTEHGAHDEGDPDREDEA